MTTTATNSAHPIVSTTTGSNSADDNNYDVVILGGGMVGSTLTCALATEPLTRSLRVALLEQRLPPPAVANKPEPDIRVSAITPVSAHIFKRIGAWDRMVRFRVTPFRDMRVWETFSRGRLHFTAADAGLENGDLGYIVENNVIQASLFHRLKECSRIAGTKLEVIAPITVTKIEVGDPKPPPPPFIPSPVPIPSPPPDWRSSWINVLLSDGRTLRTRLLVGADGPQSLVKQTVGLGSWGWDYDQSAVVATVVTDQPHSTAWQRFLPSGPVAVLPCHGSFSSIVWSSTAAHVQHLLSCTKQQFVDELNLVFRAPNSYFAPEGISLFAQPLPPSLAAMLPILMPDPQPAVPPLITEVKDGRAAFPLRFIHSSSYVKQRVALIGDAAHVIHPMAGQGVNLGIGDAFQLAATLRDGVATGRDIGDLTVLAEYERARQLVNSGMMAAVDTVKRMFSLQDGPVALARNIGLNLINNVPALKREIAKFASGFGSGLEQLIQVTNASQRSSTAASVSASASTSASVSAFASSTAEAKQPQAAATH